MAVSYVLSLSTWNT